MDVKPLNRELDDLSNKKVIERKGKGPKTYYILARFGEIKEELIKEARQRGDKS